MHVIEHKDEVIFAGERGGVRHFYMDGRAHPTPWTPTPAGHSVGRYEGNTLVVETTGFTPGGVPGGGVRTSQTTLVERFEVSPDGKQLTITYTWNDPKVLSDAHVYRYTSSARPTVTPAERRSASAGRVVRRGRIRLEAARSFHPNRSQVTGVRSS